MLTFQPFTPRLIRDDQPELQVRTEVSSRQTPNNGLVLSSPHSVKGLLLRGSPLFIL